VFRVTLYKRKSLNLRIILINSHDNSQVEGSGTTLPAVTMTAVDLAEHQLSPLFMYILKERLERYHQKHVVMPSLQISTANGKKFFPLGL
jgi:hypothetical protein